MIKKIMKNDYVLSMVNKIITVLTGFIATIFLTRYLGVVLKGQYTYILQVLQIITLVLSLGMGQSITYFYKLNGSKVVTKFMSTFIIKSILVTTFSIIASFIMEDITMLIILLYLPIFGLKYELEIIMSVINVRLKIFMHILYYILKMTGSVLLFFIGSQYLWIPFLMLGLLDLMVILVYIYYAHVEYGVIEKISLDWEFIKEVVSYSWLLVFTTLLITMNYNADVILLEHLSNPIDLGLYSVSIGIINYLWLIPDSFKDILFSRVSRSSSLEPILISIKTSVYIILMFIVIFAIFGEFALSQFFGQEFINAYGVTIILSIGAISMIFFKMIGVIFDAEGRKDLTFKILLISVVTNLILNFITIPKYGMYGAAISTVFSYSACGILCLVFFKKIYNLEIKDIFLLSSEELDKIKSIFSN